MNFVFVTYREKFIDEHSTIQRFLTLTLDAGGLFLSLLLVLNKIPTYLMSAVRENV
jgi:hypothetical protein